MYPKDIHFITLSCVDVMTLADACDNFREELESNSKLPQGGTGPEERSYRTTPNRSQCKGIPEKDGNETTPMHGQVNVTPNYRQQNSELDGGTRFPGGIIEL